VQLRARAYNPELGRFLQRDPYAGSLHSPLSLNRQSYVQNNPVNLVDPSGLKPAALRGDWLERASCSLVDTLNAASEVLSRGGGSAFGGAGRGGGQCSGGTGGSGGGGSALGGPTIFTHFTDAAGVAGITGLDPASLVAGVAQSVRELRFGYGANQFFAIDEGDIFVTDLPVNASSRQLAAIGVFGARQGYAIQFSGEDAANSGIIVRGVTNHIYVIPGGSVIGPGTLTRVR
jgi:hypothetical protein